MRSNIIPGAPSPLDTMHAEMQKVQIMKGHLQILSAILLLGPFYRERGRGRPIARHLQVSLAFTTNDNNVG